MILSHCKLLFKCIKNLRERDLDLLRYRWRLVGEILNVFAFVLYSHHAGSKFSELKEPIRRKLPGYFREQRLVRSKHPTITMGMLPLPDLSGFAVILEKLHSCLRTTPQVMSCCLCPCVSRMKNRFHLKLYKDYSLFVSRSVMWPIWTFFPFF